MRWLFSKPSSGSQRALVENKLKIKKKPLLWSLFCTKKRSSVVTSTFALRENVVDNNKSKCVRQRRRRSRLCSKLDMTRRLSSYESLSNIMNNNSEDRSSNRIDPLYDTSPQEYCNVLLPPPIAFCPTCHTNVIPVFEKDNCCSGVKTTIGGGNEMKNQITTQVLSNNYATYAVYESVYKNSILSIDTDMEYGFVECPGEEAYAFNRHDDEASIMYFLPTEPLAFSTLDRKAANNNMSDCETIYDEVASSDNEEDEEQVEPVMMNPFSGYYSNTQNHLVMLNQTNNNKPFRKRGAHPDSDPYQEMKRIRREVFVCEE